jgi:hypothetical protein
MNDFILGLDFDNTIVTYDGVFHRVAREKGLIPANIGRSKDEVRDYLRSVGREDDWTSLQGEIYGARMELAAIYEGGTETIRGLSASGMKLRIISHKTKFPFLGPRYDLHEAARGFLVQQGMIGARPAILQPSDVFFELTIEDKLARIEAEKCAIFLDDLPEILNHPKFPKNVRRLLFDPQDMHMGQRHLERIRAWRELPSLLAGA